MSFPEWAIGVLLITFGSIGNNLGNNLMSLGHMEEKNNAATAGSMSKKRNNDIETPILEAGGTQVVAEDPPQKKSWWLIGTIIFVAGSLFTFAAFGFGAQSLLAAMESIQFVSNVFFVFFVHGQPVTVRMVTSTLSICAGNILVVIFSDHAENQLFSEDINHLYLNNTAYQVYAIVALVLCLSSYLIFRHYYHSRVELKLPRLWRTQAVLQSKTLSMLLQATFKGSNQFTQPTVYIVLVVWLIFVSFWLNRLNRALDLFPPLFIIPVMQVFFVFFAIVSGGIFFEEFADFGAEQWAGFVVGVLLIFIGVYGLAPPDEEVFSPEDPFEVQIRPKRRASKLIEGQIIYQMPPNLPDPDAAERRKSILEKRKSIELLERRKSLELERREEAIKEDLANLKSLLEDPPLLEDTVPALEIMTKPVPIITTVPGMDIVPMAAPVSAEEPCEVKKTGTRKVYKFNGGASGGFHSLDNTTGNS
jgi:hypothetical protein